MICPNCKKEIPNEAKFCLYCGAKIDFDNSTIECPSCHARIPKDSKFCPDCGGKIRINDNTTKNDCPIPYYDSGSHRWGYRNVSGNIVVEPKYDDATRFCNNIAIVCEHDYYAYKSRYKSYVIDADGHQVLKLGDEHISCFCFGIKGQIIYHHHQTKLYNLDGSIIDLGYNYKYIKVAPQGLYLVSKGYGEEYGFIDDKGVEIIPCKYKRAREFSEGIAAVQDQNGNWGFVDTNGKLIIPCIYSDAKSFSCGLAKVQTHDNQRCFIDKQRNVYLKGCDVGDFFSDDLVPVFDKYKQKWGFCDKEGNVKIEHKYDLLPDNQYPFINGLCSIRIEGRNMQYGYIDINGNEIIRPQYEWGDWFIDGIAIVRKNRKYGLIDTKGTNVLSCIFKSIEWHHSGLFEVIDDENSKYYADLKGNLTKK